MDFIFNLLVVFILVLLNGFFVASEFSLVAIRKSRIEELVRKGNKTALSIQNALKDLESVISATQLGITLASLALGWLGEPALAHFLEPFFYFLPRTVALLSAHSVAVIIAFTTITILHIVIGELAPKTIALQRAEKTALVIIKPLLLFTTVFRPFIFLLNTAGNLVLKAIGFSTANASQRAHSEEEIKILLNQSQEGGAIEKSEAEMIRKIFRLDDIPIDSIMTPRTEIVAFDISAKLKDVTKIIKNSTLSRFPVYEKSIDNIIGFIHVKDINKVILSKKNLELALSRLKVLRKIIHVLETKKADDVLLEMRKQRIHMAAINDEFGGTAGIVTFEDIIESIFGEIEDEFDKPFKVIKKQPDKSYLVDALVSVEDLKKRIKLKLKGQGYTTIGGVVYGLLGRTARIGDTIQIGDIRLEVIGMNGKRIKTIKIKKVK